MSLGRKEGVKVTGVKVPVGVVGASAVLGSHVAQGTLPFTGIALAAYIAVGGGLVLTGLALRLISHSNRT
jgi:hypothetical protein